MNYYFVAGIALFGLIMWLVGREAAKRESARRKSRRRAS